VAIIRGTRINFAVPADLIKPILDGRIEECTYGDPFMDDNEVKLPVKVEYLDPLKHVKAMRVEVWAGDKGAARPFGTERPAPLPGDGPRKSIDIDHQNGIAKGDVALPTLKDGQVYWLQPVVVDGAGVTRWHTALPRDATPPLERVPAELLIKFDQGPVRTLRMKDTIRLSVQEGKNQFSQALKLDATVLEAVTPGDRGTSVGLSIGPNHFTEEDMQGQVRTFEPRINVELRKQGPTFLVDPTGRLRERNPRLSATLPKKEYDTLKMMLSRICNVFEQTSLYLPNRKLGAMETWSAMVPMVVERAGVPNVLDLDLTCTYLGSRTVGDRKEALIGLTGTTRGRDKKAGKDSTGHVSGRVAFDLGAGFISQVRMNIRTEFDTGMQLRMFVHEEIDLDRLIGTPETLPEVALRPKGAAVPANPMPPKTPMADPKPPMPEPKPPMPEPKAPVPEPKSPEPKSPMPKNPAPMIEKTVLDVKGTLMTNDFLGGPKARKHKAYDFKMEEGKTYVIEMKAMESKPGSVSRINPFLQLLDPAGKEVGRDDDGGANKDAKLTFTATQTGTYRIVATTMTGLQVGAYHLTVTTKE